VCRRARPTCGSRSVLAGARPDIGFGAETPVVGHHDFRPAPLPEVLDLAQAAELLIVDPSAVLELAESGELPGRRIGGAWRFSRAALLSWLAGT
jgi:excisionase family DNA binding protein